MSDQSRFGRSAMVAAGLALAMGCGSDRPTEPVTPPPPPPEVSPSIAVISGADVSDTIGSVPSERLTIEVRGRNGKPASGRVVRFEVPYPDYGGAWERQGEFIVAICGTGRGDCAAGAQASFAVDTTDAMGRAYARLRFGTFAGRMSVSISVPEFGLRDDAAFTVFAGSPTSVVLPVRDHVVMRGASFTEDGAVRDRKGNRRAAPVTFSATGAASVDAAGRVTGLFAGRAIIRATALGLSDSTALTVVPVGELAGVAHNMLFASRFDGTGLRRVIAGTDRESDFGDAPAWLADGSIAFTRGSGIVPSMIFVADLAGSVRRLHPTTSALGYEALPRGGADGWVYFTGGPREFTFSLWRSREDGSAIESLLPNPDYSVVNWRSVPSPDAKRVAYVSNAAGFVELRLLDLASGFITVLAIGGQSPSFSPDGQWIAYVDGPSARLFVVHPDGTGMRAVSRAGHAFVHRLDWSPDGEWIVASSYENSYDPVPYFVRLTDGEELPIRLGEPLSVLSVRR
jgi:WD40-like Beta Propeller Repeat